jgi:DNA polymerase
MQGHPAVLGRANGARRAALMFVGEAPGRLGAHRTGKPFVGDRSGANFMALLEGAGIGRRDVYVTNAVLCCPTDGKRNDRPAASEIANCGSFLRRTIELVRPCIVATLGAVALDAVWRQFGNDRSRPRLAECVARPESLDEFTLFALYHPSPRVMNTRRDFDAQRADYKQLRHLFVTLRA